MKNLKKYKKVLFLLLIVVAFFTASLTITWDSAHYLSYVDIFENVKPFSSWDIVRGPVFPTFIFIGDKVFGKTANGLLCLIFLVYLIYVYFTIKISEQLFKKCKYNKVLSTVFVMFSIFNPIIFGYFHTLLTEFMVITLMIMSCYISWKWIEVDNKKQKIFYSLFYIYFLQFSYFLKQPYICTILIPLIISTIFSIVKNHNLKNIIYRFITIITSLLALIMSIALWNYILITGKVDMNTGRDSSSLLSEQLLLIPSFKTTTIDNYSDLKNDKSLSKQERKFSKKVIKEKGQILLIKIYDGKRLVESDVLEKVDNKVSAVDSLLQIIKFSIKHPVLSSGSYSKNYCALSSICVIESDNGVEYTISNKIDLTRLFENNTIAYRFFYSDENMFYLSKEKYESAKYYHQISSRSLTTRIISKFAPITNIVYKSLMVILPFITLLVLIVGFINKRKLEKNEYSFSIIFLSSSLLTIIACTIVGQIIDRYAVYCFIPALVGIISGVSLLIKAKK